MRQAGREAAELARANRLALAVDLDLDAAFEDDEALVALSMDVRCGIGPALVGVVEPDLELV